MFSMQIQTDAQVRAGMSFLGLSGSYPQAI